MCNVDESVPSDVTAVGKSERWVGAGALDAREVPRSENMIESDFSECAHDDIFNLQLHWMAKI